MKMILKFLFTALIVSVIASATFSYAFGHGVGYETLPPQMLGDKRAAMEVNSIVDNATGRREVTFSLFDTNTGITVRDVKYHVKAIKNDQVLFEVDHSTTNGVLVLDLIPGDSEKITTQEKTGNLFGSLLGLEKNPIEAKGKIFKFGGLYKFSIDILAAENYQGMTPVRFEAGISFPESLTIQVNDENYGKQELKAITYYELLTGLNYDAKTKSIIFSMPFEWTLSNINQTQVIHQEVTIPKTFGTIQTSGYVATVNGMTLSNQTMTIDDFTTNDRIIHLLVYQSELLRLYGQNNNQHEMNFAISPKSDDLLLISSTDNVQYKLALTTLPKYLSAGDDVSFLFKIYDIFLHEKTVAVNYDLFVKSDGKELYKTSGKSTDVKDVWNEVKFTIPQDASGMIVLHFENLGGNGLARAEIPILLVKHNPIPSWIKSNAGWWCTNSISDDDFLKGIEYLIVHGVIQIQESSQNEGSGTIPQWVKNNSCWWADGSISDSEFINAIAFLVKIGLINP